MAWVFVGSLVIVAIRFFRSDPESAGAARTSGRGPSGPVVDVDQRIPAPSPAGGPQPPNRPPAASVEPGALEQDERRRHRAKPRDVVQDAMDAIADTYRDRLQTILEHQDGAEWLAKFNQRRHVSMIQEGKAAPQPYKSLEPRAVLSCLAYDPAGLQLISTAAAKSAKQLLGLANEALHANPHAPLTEADGYRAWRLYTDITGRIADGDPFER